MPGTKDAGHNFNAQLTEHLVTKLGLTPNPANGASFYGKFGSCWFRLNSYVDDFTAFSNSQVLRGYQRAISLQAREGHQADRWPQREDHRRWH